MTKKLIIAEKPSVAADLARALSKAPGLSAFHKEGDFFENETHVITSAVGHLLEQERLGQQLLLREGGHHEALHADRLAPVRRLLRVRLLVDIQARGHQKLRTRGPRRRRRQGAHEERTATPKPPLTMTFPCVRIHMAIPAWR